MPESLKNHDTWGAQVCRVGTRKCTTYQVLSIFTGESGIWCQKPERPNNTFPVFATYLIPPASPPPLRGGAKSASNPFARARKPHTWFFSLSGSVALPGFTLMPARSGFAWQPQMLSWHLLRRLVLCHRSPTWFRMLTAHRFLFYFCLVCLPVALQVSILAAQLDVAEGGAPHSQSARVPLSSSSASSR